MSDIRAYRERQLAGTGLTPVFPLWGLPTDKLAREMIGGGLRARLTAVDVKKLDRDFAGREFDSDLIADLPQGVDPCGENGEFHTCVTAGPMFRGALDLAFATSECRDGMAFADFELRR